MENTADIETRTQEILLAASNHDLSALKPFLRIPGAASVQDMETGCTPLHAAIGACEKEEGDEDEVDMEKAKDVVRELFLAGAIWNDLDGKGETPGCLAWRLRCEELYELCVEAGVRAEVLLGLMGGYVRLGDERSDDEEEGEEEVDEAEKQEAEDEDEEKKEAIHGQKVGSPPPLEQIKDVNSADYLASTLTITPTTLLDSSSNGVMMDWETPIMARTVELLAPTPGLRILNIGFGLGIIDSLFAATNPSSHHIIEAHPAVLSHLDSLPATSPFSTNPASTWSVSNGGHGVIHGGKWQDVIPQLIELGEVFDVIYFDTFGESYDELKMLFQEYVIALLDGEGRWGWWNGLGADRRVCYDVYCRVVEMDLGEAGFEVEWEGVPVRELGDEGEGEWVGVRRRYWVLDEYRLPVCRFMG